MTETDSRIFNVTVSRRSTMGDGWKVVAEGTAGPNSKPSLDHEVPRLVLEVISSYEYPHPEENFGGGQGEVADDVFVYRYDVLPS